MVYFYVVEYQFQNRMSTQIKRQRYSGTLEGLSIARKQFQSLVKYIQWNQSEDYEQVELIAYTSINGLVSMWHFDTEHGYKYHNPQEVYADG